MDRLTTRNSVGVAVYKHPYECERCGEPLYRLPDDGNGSQTDKLAEYEDLEEQGRLLRLPCKVGDKIYEVFNGYRKSVIHEHTVSKFVYQMSKVPRIEIHFDGEKGFLLSDISGKLDENLYLTREEAEAKLKERETIWAEKQFQKR